MIDILMATYNGEKYLKEQIDSILEQSYQNIKLIISDDFSKDKTIQILKEYQEQDKRVEVFFQQENLGVVKNIEFLLNKVTSSVFMLADQDDFWMKEKIKKSYELLKNSNSDLVFTDLEVVDKDLNTIYPSFNDYMLLTRKINKCLDNNRLNYLYNCVTGCTICAKSKIIKDILPLPNNSKFVIHDYWIGIITSLNGKVSYLPDKTIKYRQHENNQVGTEKISHGFTKFEQVREWFIEVKLGIFIVFKENKEKFPIELQELTQKSYEYFSMLKNKKYFNFKYWSVFHELYKTEKLLYYLENFLIFNMPFIAKFLFKIRYFILKIIGKRK